MKNRMLLVVLCIISLFAFLSAQVTTSYSWEDGGTILSYYGTVANPANVGSTGGVDPYDGSAMLTVSESPLSSTPQAFIAFIENLNEGDVVTASFYGYDNTPDASPSLRIWGGYALNGDIDSYQGSASGPTSYTNGSGWSQSSFTWTIAAGMEALVVQARLYSGTEDPTVYFIDLVSVTAPATATVTYPSPPVLTANAGPDQTVSVNSTVTLDGSASIGTIVSYSWVQIGTPAVTLSGADAVSATFTAPATAVELQFELTVSESGGASDKDTVNIAVSDVSTSPVFITEYVEGTSNNKYLEIYNGGTFAVDLEAEGYTLARDNNGDQDFTYAVLSDWGTLKVLPAGGIIVLAADGHTLYDHPDSVLTYNSPVHFNGNDAVALLKNGVIVDLVGELGNSANYAIDVTLRRLDTVTEGKSVFDWNEWTQLPLDDISGLGMFNVSIPAFSNYVIPTTLVFDNVAVNVQVDVTPTEGGAAIASGVVAYGPGFLTTSAMFNDGNTWYAEIPAAATTANTEFEFKFIVTDANSVIFESAVQSFMVASTSPMSIANIHANIGTLDGTIQTIKGNVSIGSGLLASAWTSLYIQDGSGRGLNLYKSATDVTLALGQEATVVGEVDIYTTTVEIKDFAYKITPGSSLVPAPATVNIADVLATPANYEGTLIKLTGTVTANTAYTSATSITISDGNNETTVRVYATTGIDATQYTVGQPYTFVGVGSQYNSAFQLLIGYEASTYLTVDAAQATRPMHFGLAPAYPNPFNPTTTLTWQVEQAGEYTLAVYNLLGQEMGVLHTGLVPAGRYITEWNAGALSSGVYFVRLVGAGQQTVRKVMLLK
ncbi:MAG: lamin tail domain-containing protein [Candidatus Neomarinimicrobiota bacterium]